jgi:hypothetical protein
MRDFFLDPDGCFWYRWPPNDKDGCFCIATHSFNAGVRWTLANNAGTRRKAKQGENHETHISRSRRDCGIDRRRCGSREVGSD